jgi:hypothetical protein
VKIPRTLFWSAISCAHVPCFYVTFISFAFFNLSNRRFSKKNWSLPVVLFWQIFATICICLLISFFLSYFDHGTFEEVATVADMLICVVLELKLNQKWIYYLAYTNVANKNCVKFCMKEVFKCRERRMMTWDEVWTKVSSLGMPMSSQEISNKYKHQSLGMPWGTPSSSTNIKSPFKTLYFYCFVFYAFFLEHLYFRF